MNILITGAVQGIGLSIAEHLCSGENILILVDKHQDKLESVKSELSNSCKEIVLLAGDLSEESFIQNLTSYIGNNTIDVLVNNAAIAHELKNFTELTTNDLDLAYRINIKTPFELMKSALTGMKNRGSGSIVNVTSRASIYGYPRMGIYAASKAAINSLSGTIALENSEIKVVTIVPGRTNTQLQAELRGKEEAENSQSPDFVGDIIAKVVTSEIPSNSGDHVLIDGGKYKVTSELSKEDLHRNMH